MLAGETAAEETISERIDSLFVRSAIEFTVDVFLSRIKEVADYDSIAESTVNIIHKDFKKLFGDKS